ncbi:MAG: DUF2085 domain-containing protein [Balneolaceae bacterium]
MNKLAGMQYKRLYAGVFIALTFLVLFALGEGFWGGDGKAVHWTKKLFYGVCHQLPGRTFTYNDVPMAVNSRCFGIFLGLLIGWLLIPAVKPLTAGTRWTVGIFFVAVMLQIIDYSGNLFHLWENTNQSRAFLGWILGFSASIVVSGLFQITTKNKDL